MAVGTIREFNHAGFPFRIPEDTSVSKTPNYTVEGLPTSGGNEVQITTATGQIESIKVRVTPEEHALAEGLVLTGPHPTSVVYADGSSHRGPARINVGPMNSADGTAEITAIPVGGPFKFIKAQ